MRIIINVNNCRSDKNQNYGLTFCLKNLLYTHIIYIYIHIYKTKLYCKMQHSNGDGNEMSKKMMMMIGICE